MRASSRSTERSKASNSGSRTFALAFLGCSLDYPGITFRAARKTANKQIPNLVDSSLFETRLGHQLWESRNEPMPSDWSSANAPDERLQ